MEFFLGWAAGVATYQVLFKLLGIDEDASTALGWLVGVLIVCYYDKFAAIITNKTKGKNKAKEDELKLRIKELELQLKLKENKEEEAKKVKNKMEFFRKDKEMDM